ncbi:response regulator [Azospirillum thermophilum]|uniref:Response regulator n=1 Tax=Azospirillum thermophilum TaxID=2202148 RepID=A0A2S2CQB0_9PROT|nr:response regulator [Azospirillum thermophilum]
MVEDEALVAMLFQTALEGEGHRVTLAGDGVEALEADDSDPADAVVTDMNMPRMNGKELVTRIRQRRPGLPVILISGYAAQGGPLASDASTVVLSKPISPRLLARTLSSLIPDQ